MTACSPRQCGSQYGLFRACLAGGSALALLAATWTGCSMFGLSVVQATATLPSSVLQDGKLIQIVEGGVYRSWNQFNAGIGFIGVSRDLNGLYAGLSLGSSLMQPTPADLHLGESANLPGLGKITLVSFDNSDGIQMITLLIEPEASAPPAPTDTPS